MSDMTIIPYGRQSIDDDDIHAVCEVLRSDWLTQGPTVRRFEEALCGLTGAAHCVAVSNGTEALHLACMALRIPRGARGVTSPVSFMASANCIALCGGSPDFADIDPRTLCLSPDEVERYCERSGAPAVVIPVDFAGVPAELPRFKELSEKYGFSLIEDAAHAVGSTYTWEGKDYACGSCAHTDLAVFSFHPVKTITTGEGGAVLTNDERLAARVRLLGNHGIERDAARMVGHGTDGGDPASGDTGVPAPWYHEMQALGFNSRITDLQCALGLSQLTRLRDFKRRRQAIARHYTEAFQDLAADRVVALPPWPEETDPCFHLYPIRLADGCGLSRDRAFHELRGAGIFCQVHYIPIYRQPFYVEHYGYDVRRFPETEHYYESCLSIPLFPGMDDGEVDRVVDTVHAVLRRQADDASRWSGQ